MLVCWLNSSYHLFPRIYINTHHHMIFHHIFHFTWLLFYCLKLSYLQISKMSRVHLFFKFQNPIILFITNYTPRTLIYVGKSLQPAELKYLVYWELLELNLVKVLFNYQRVLNMWVELHTLITQQQVHKLYKLLYEWHLQKLNPTVSSFYRNNNMLILLEKIHL